MVKNLYLLIWLTNLKVQFLHVHGLIIYHDLNLCKKLHVTLFLKYKF